MTNGATKEEVVLVVKTSEVKVLAAIEGTRNQVDVLEQTIKPELLWLRTSIAWLKAKYERFTTL
jgi:hypothetical protein